MQALRRQTPCGLLEVAIPDEPQISFRRQIEDGALYEPATVDAISSTLPVDGVFYDIGARWGYFSCLAVRCGAESVIAFEPGERDCLPILRENAHETPIRVIEREVTESLDPPFAAQSPDIAKIDVEGDEHAVLRWLSANDLLPDALVIEMHPAYIRDAGSSQVSLIADLQNWGYALEFSAGHRGDDYGWAPVDPQAIPSGITDYLLLASR